MQFEFGDLVMAENHFEFAAELNQFPARFIFPLEVFVINNLASLDPDEWIAQNKASIEETCKWFIRGRKWRICHEIRMKTDDFKDTFGDLEKEQPYG